MDGSYFIRLRPNYALYDMISKREYMYNMFAFSMPPVNGSSLLYNGFQTLELGQDNIGYINGSDY